MNAREVHMSESAIGVRTEVYGLELSLSSSQLVLSAGGQSLTAPIVLRSDDAERLRLELAKAQLWEWNQFEALKSRAEKRYRHYLGSWLVLCLAAFSAYIGYPSYAVPLFLSALSIFIWWRAGYEEQKADREARAERNRFVPEWSYFQQRTEESA
jgi:hypothetical protein